MSKSITLSFPTVFNQVLGEQFFEACAFDSVEQKKGMTICELFDLSDNCAFDEEHLLLEKKVPFDLLIESSDIGVESETTTVRFNLDGTYTIKQFEGRFRSIELSILLEALAAGRLEQCVIEAHREISSWEDQVALFNKRDGMKIECFKEE